MRTRHGINFYYLRPQIIFSLCIKFAYVKLKYSPLGPTQYWSIQILTIRYFNSWRGFLNWPWVIEWSYSNKETKKSSRVPIHKMIFLKSCGQRNTRQCNAWLRIVGLENVQWIVVRAVNRNLKIELFWEFWSVITFISSWCCVFMCKWCTLQRQNIVLRRVYNFGNLKAGSITD